MGVKFLQHQVGETDAVCTHNFDPALTRAAWFLWCVATMRLGADPALLKHSRVPG